MTMKISDWGVVGDDIIGGKDIEEVAGEDRKNYLRVP